MLLTTRYCGLSNQRAGADFEKIGKIIENSSLRRSEFFSTELAWLQLRWKKAFN